MYTSRYYRLYPSEEQQRRLSKHFGCARVAYNTALDYSQQVYRDTGKSVSYHDLAKRLPTLKRQFPYLWHVSAQCLQQAVNDFCQARQNSFILKRGFPKHRIKKSRQSVRFQQGNRVDMINNTVHVRKIGAIAAIVHCPIGGVIKSITISKNSIGQYHAAVLVDDERVYPEESISGKTIGIDLGLKEFLVTSDGCRVTNPRHFNKSRRNLKHKQQKLSRCKKGSNRRKKAALTVAKIHLKIANQRKDFHHKVSRTLVDENQVIVFEDLNIKGMLKNHRLARAIGDVGWGKFVTACKYKARRVGKMVLKCGRYTPTSTPCSRCGTINPDLKLSHRVWTCRACGETHDRDHNAAINIVRGGLLKVYAISRLLDHGYLKRA